MTMIYLKKYQTQVDLRKYMVYNVIYLHYKEVNHMYQQQALLEALKNEYSRQSQLLGCLERRQDCLPSGFLSCKNGYYYRVISSRGKTDQIPIPQDYADRDALIYDLKERRHIAKALPILRKNLVYYEKAIAQFQLYDPARLQMPSSYADFDFSNLLLKGDVNPVLWVAEPYPHNKAFPEDLIYQSEGGLLTRSKAEADIATMLERNRIVFRYEPELRLDRHLYYPDFCIIHPIHRRILYWEHFGKMDDPEYAHNTMEKIRVYSQHGYHLGQNFIMTWETKAHPLHFGHINDRILTYLS